MIRSRFSLLGVLVAAMGLMAFFASAAQAEEGAKWLVLKESGVLLTNEQILANNTKYEVGSLENNTGSLLSEIGSTKISILCTALELIDALLNDTGGIKNGAKAKFTGCKFFMGGTNGLEKEQPKCQPKTNGGPLGTVEMLGAHALVQLHKLASDGKLDEPLLISPDSAEGELSVFEMGASCAFGEQLSVFGLIALQDCGGVAKGLEHLLTHLVTEFAPLTTLALFALRGKPGAKNASIDGSANVKLSTDELWAGDPG